MKTKKFWKWRNQTEAGTAPEERTLFLNGTIAEESWFDDDVTPQLFKDELNAGNGDITVWINSPGGDCVAAAQIYNMLSNYKGKVTVKIDGIAASAASVIAMAGDTVLVSPVSMLMIHNPATIAWGDHAEMQKAIDMLAGVKESIINAYVLKTGLSRPKLSHLMDAETWMDANKAVELGFADEIMARAKAEPEKEPEEGAGGGSPEEDEEDEKKFPPAPSSMLFSRRAANNALLNKLAAKYGGEKPKADIRAQAEIPAPETETGRSVDALMERLHLLRH
jgi:ATP-dependent Clp protease protease subunit